MMLRNEILHTIAQAICVEEAKVQFHHVTQTEVLMRCISCGLPIAYPKYTELVKKIMEGANNASSQERV